MQERCKQNINVCYKASNEMVGLVPENDLKIEPFVFDEK